MLVSFKNLLVKVWKSIEEAQMARANQALKNGMWSRMQ